jgi:hypothetical protein
MERIVSQRQVCNVPISGSFAHQRKNTYTCCQDQPNNNAKLHSLAGSDLGPEADSLEHRGMYRLTQYASPHRGRYVPEDSHSQPTILPWLGPVFWGLKALQLSLLPAAEDLPA